jgi:NADH-quinone oxidoreductase subunit L
VTSLATLATAEGAASAATGVTAYAWLLVALPLLGAAILLIGGRATDKWGPLLAVGLSWAAFVIGFVVWVAMLGRDPGARAQSLHLYSWVPAGSFKVDAGMLVDQLSMSFVLLVTFVGSLILVYSLGYMEHDPDKRRFFGYLNLFVASMLLLVLADSYLLLYVGWEGVGLASYLLIGFWSHNPAYATAGNKAFVANRVGDVGLSIAIMVMFWAFGRVDFAGVSAASGNASEGVLTAIGLMLLLAACGKSAQFPLQSWLGDAMAGPTPVSALIHAATMVTAGVYLIVRSNFIFSLTEDARTGVVIVGCITLLLGAIIGCAKDDIKKALAGSTMSQIGYMVLAAGLGPVGYAFAIFHLLTHGFFKANMFLGAGSVMHGTNDDVDMRHYGALQKAMPITFVTFAVGYLAIIGVPPFAGFWSKDKIIESAFADNVVVGLCALVGAGITAFYMTRLMLMTFLGEKRWEPDVHPHESPRVMTIPLIALAALSALGGFMLLNGWIVDWLSPVVGEHAEHELGVPAWAMSLIVLAVVAIGIAVAWVFVGQRPVPREAPTQVSVFTRVARAELYGDAINDEVVVKPGYAGIRGLTVFDRSFVDGLAEGTAAAFSGMSNRFRHAQNGFVRSYALAVLSGAALALLALLAVNFS